MNPLPDGCPHLPWVWEHPDESAPAPGYDDRRGRLLGPSYATWTVCPGVPADLDARRVEWAAQGLATDGEPHQCQSDPDGTELWVVALIEQ